MPEVHALLSASSSKQWLNCPPSARLQENFSNESSVYAEEGTFAHSICEYKVKNTEVTISSLNDGKNYIVTNGLKSGDKIVIEGVQKVRDGQEIVPLTSEQQKAKYDQALKDQKEGNLQTAFQ